ncbi:tryptophan 7-halogenase [Oxalobacteraceae bacterium R-40]|uniref:Tryptophan 7-halogenase n=1 Tax=Keguizhuia sedimenti TaxID=3064264 RepID=A0ABU1BS00_9BURK|nr:tryptophan 7-halogenase [Oxalobacteraceae bacterium R-40]
MSSASAPQQYDVAILGGGLAGLTLSLQLKRRFPELSILVLERRAHPVPLAAHKVGESSVEIAAHYFDTVLGLKQHLMDEQLKKFGFRFFFSDGRRDFDKVTELGASRMLPTGSYQIDRGIFENKLGQLALEAGVRFIDQAMVREFSLNNTEAHRVVYETAGSMHEVQCRWLVDASGRAGLVKRKLGLAQPNEHNAGAVWFRISAHIDVNDWSDDPEWLNRCNPPNRWLSTNHLVGKGYWVWLIPLASGSHSIGIVVDNDVHPVDSINSFEKAMNWLETHQPRLFDHLQTERDKLQDFAFFRRFSYDCKQVYSGRQRWALTGEAGRFLDPFYSPGSDFIATSNTFITELIAHDRNKGPVAMYAELYDQVFHTLYRTMMSLYLGQYDLFEDPEVMPHKVAWDYTYYWGIMCPLFYQNKLVDIGVMARLQKPLSQSQELNEHMQRFLRAWSRLSKKRNPAQMLDQAGLEWFAELNRGLKDVLDDAGFRQRMAENFALLQRLAEELFERAVSEHDALTRTEAGMALQSFLESVKSTAGSEPATVPGGTGSLLFSNAAY